MCVEESDASGGMESFLLMASVTILGLAIFQRWHIVALRGCPV